MKIYFTTHFKKGDYTNFTFRFGPKGRDWWEYLSINSYEFSTNRVYTKVTSERLRNVCANFCRRMKMEGCG